MRLFAIVFILFSAFVFSGVKLKKVKLTETTTISLPADFLPMTDDDIAKKYFTYRKPIATFTNPDRLADFSFNEAVTPWRKEDTELLKKFYKASIVKLYDKTDFKQEAVVEINGRNFAVFEFTSEVQEKNKESANFGKITRGYDYIQYTVENHKVQIFHFSCPYNLRESWQLTAAKIMKTAKIKAVK